MVGGRGVRGLESTTQLRNYGTTQLCKRALPAAGGAWSPESNAALALVRAPRPRPGCQRSPWWQRRERTLSDFLRFGIFFSSFSSIFGIFGALFEFFSDFSSTPSSCGAAGRSGSGVGRPRRSQHGHSNVSCDAAKRRARAGVRPPAAPALPGR